MDKVRVFYKDDKTIIKHMESDSTIFTSPPKEYGGPGDSFSSTDLLIAALGNCIITTIDNIIQREGGHKNHLSISLSKELTSSPKELRQIKMKLEIPLYYTEKLEKKLNVAINSCPVFKVLSKGTDIDTCFYWKE